MLSNLLAREATTLVPSLNVFWGAASKSPFFTTPLVKLKVSESKRGPRKGPRIPPHPNGCVGHAAQEPKAPRHPRNKKTRKEERLQESHPKLNAVKHACGGHAIKDLQNVEGVPTSHSAELIDWCIYCILQKPPAIVLDNFQEYKDDII